MTVLLVKQQSVLDLLVADGIEVLQRAILKLLLDGFDTEPMCDRRVNLHVFNRLIASLLLGHTIHSPHIVQTVRELDDNDADIIRHSDKHFADILRLLLLAGGIRYFRDFGNAVYQLGNVAAELLADLVKRYYGILNNVVEQSAANAVGVESQLRDNAGDRGRVQNIRDSRNPSLVAVAALGKTVGFLDFS